MKKQSPAKQSGTTPSDPVPAVNYGESSAPPRCRVFASSRYLPLYVLAAVYISTSLILRIVLLFFFAAPGHVPLLHFPAILILGTVNDLVETLYLLAPCTLLLLLTPQRLYNSTIGRALTAVLLWILCFGMLYLGAVQFFFFQEFDARFNLVAVDYLLYPHEVFVNIWQSYPVGRVLLFMAAISSIIMLFLWPKIGRSMRVPTRTLQRLPLFCLYWLLIAIAMPTFSTHTFGLLGNRVSNELTANGLSSFFQAFRTNQLDYSQFYRTENSSKMFGLLRRQLTAEGGHLSSTEPTDINRSFPAAGQGLGKLNVVVIVEESLGCNHVDVCGQGRGIEDSFAASPLHKTPFLDQLASQGMFFNRAYATGTRTVRGLEAISASFPPIPSESIIKRPGGEHIATWGKVMRANGYHTSFLYGGYSRFDNMKTYFKGNGFAISDRLDIAEPVFTNIWGVSDQDLFQHARSYFDSLARQKKPFFSIVMTTSNHSPFTFPKGIAGIPPEGGGRNAGILYADYALRDFFTKAKNHSWYTNTLFVIVADHGARVYGAAQIPIASYEIPLLFFAPGHIKPSQVQTPISQIDIAPTVLGLLGLPYKAPFFGRNILADTPAPSVLLFNHNHDVALYRDEELVILGLRNTVTTYRYTLGTDKFTRTDDNPGLTDLATAYYQCAFELFKGGRYQ